MDLPRYNLRFDRAYWVSELEVGSGPDPQRSGTIEATTFARGGHELTDSDTHELRLARK